MPDNLLFQSLRIAGTVYVLLNIGACALSGKLIFQPQPSSYTDTPKTLKITTPNGEKISALFLENPNAEYTLLFNHGNAEDLGQIAPFLSQYKSLGFSILMYDYRGYGTSEGKPSEKHTYEDVEACYNWLINEKKIPPARIIAQGRSVGGGPAIWLAAHHEVGGLIVESTFVSAFRVKTIIPLTPWDKFPNLKNIRKVNCPVLVMHGREDEILPFWHGEKLFAAAPEPKMNYWIDGAHHNDYTYVAGKTYFDTVLTFTDMIKRRNP